MYLREESNTMMQGSIHYDSYQQATVNRCLGINEREMARVDTG
jgi:hypothetical protein